MTSSYPELTTADVAVTLTADLSLGLCTLAAPELPKPRTKQLPAPRTEADMADMFAWAAGVIEEQCEWLRVREDLPPDQTWVKARQQKIEYSTVFVPCLAIRVYELTPFIPPGGGMNSMYCSQRQHEKLLAQIEEGKGFIPIAPDTSGTAFLLAARGVLGVSLRVTDRVAPRSDLI